MDDAVLNWLLEENEPHIRYRAMRELLGMPREHPSCIKTREMLLPALSQTADTRWERETKGLWLIYNLVALAECGLIREDISVEEAVSRALEPSFDGGCGDALLLRALVMLGYGGDERVRQRLAAFGDTILPDGGFLCLHRLSKRRDTPKSCYKANLHAIMLYGECAKRGIGTPGFAALPDYFLQRKIFYRSDAPDALVLDAREGWRTIDTFHPMEVMRVGVHCVVEALCSLGYGKTAQCEHARLMLDKYKGENGRYSLAGTLAKSYLPKERVGKPSKWVTLYALMADKAG